ncbi:NAD(P)-dependent glycerol-3-phosphate dehydrogenase [Pacificimonas sp. WHA3]|uniref:Glycerol-3-phosphate dehydrogenase [NAD(P)+] n=1 Tax=Pacificimonas pallii TaxID=2827236 RepID=A0ABS6SAG1_9SPHN|nr:NAD(P)H-dependent glycerol-3-phosphate dehydrogenase [Pacificimonas pallii]MBV7255357.1 NAD(P)-dependent glycerol-3-phosphate dehydrogenase [Pacificimonas pallii]
MKLGVVGAGAWGTALAQICAAGGPTRLWAREEQVAADISSLRENRTFLPGIALSDAIAPTSRMADLDDCDALLLVCPAQHLRATLSSLDAGQRPLILCCKGIEADTEMLMTEVAADVSPAAPIAVLSGPTFAAEVASGLPTAITFACADTDTAAALVKRIAQPRFRPYMTDDLIGAEVGGAVKNVLAIACGVATGLDLGQNARAALISRGFAEMTRFGLAKGARAETMGGLSGLGDLVLTCSSEASRNMSFGKALGEGRSAAALMADRVTVAEGVHTAPVLARAARSIGVEMPIADTVLALIEGQLDAHSAISALLSRPLRTELPMLAE